VKNYENNRLDRFWDRFTFQWWFSILSWFSINRHRNSSIIWHSPVLLYALGVVFVGYGVVKDFVISKIEKAQASEPSA